MVDEISEELASLQRVMIAQYEARQYWTRRQAELAQADYNEDDSFNTGQGKRQQTDGNTDHQNVVGDGAQGLPEGGKEVVKRYGPYEGPQHGCTTQFIEQQ